MVAQKIIHRNGKEMNFKLNGDALKPVTAIKPADILFMDPPYGKGLWELALPQFLIQGWIDENTLIIVEEDKNYNVKVPPHFVLQEKRASGRNTFYFLKKGD